MTTNIYLSPHFDDIALSCGGLVARQMAAGERGLCLTIFAAPAAPGAEMTAYAHRLHVRWGEGDPAKANALRRLEEITAMRLLGLELVMLDYPDAIYRGARYDGNAGLIGGPVHADEAGLAADLALSLSTLLAGEHRENVTIYAPLALGEHVDHQIVFDAARLLAAQGWSVLHYEDYPYAERPQALAARLNKLGYALPGAPPSARPVASPIYYEISPGLDTRIAAIAAYRSQISSLFPDLASLPGAVRKYAAAVAADWQEAGPVNPPPFYAERYWRLPVV